MPHKPQDSFAWFCEEKKGEQSKQRAGTSRNEKGIIGDFEVFFRGYGSESYRNDQKKQQFPAVDQTDFWINGLKGRNKGQNAIKNKRPKKGRKSRPTFLFDMKDQPRKKGQ